MDTCLGDLGAPSRDCVRSFSGNTFLYGGNSGSVSIDPYHGQHDINDVVNSNSFFGYHETNGFGGSSFMSFNHGLTNGSGNNNNNSYAHNQDNNGVPTWDLNSFSPSAVGPKTSLAQTSSASTKFQDLNGEVSRSSTAPSSSAPGIITTTTTNMTTGSSLGSTWATTADSPTCSSVFTAGQFMSGASDNCIITTSSPVTSANGYDQNTGLRQQSTMMTTVPVISSSMVSQAGHVSTGSTFRT